MIELADFLTSIGKGSLSSFWFPLGLWTLFAACTAGVLWLNDSIPSVYQLHSRTALLVALPLSIFGSALAGFWASLNGSATAGAASLFVIQNPISVASASQNTAAANWLDPFLWSGFLLVLLALGSLTAIFYLAKNLFKLRSFSIRLDFKPFNSVFDSCDINISGKDLPQIAFSDESEVPFTYGWLKSKIVLPESLQGQDQKLKLAVKHELMHIRHNDFLVNNFLALIRCLFWFHPLTHILHNRCKEYREITCDSEVLSDSTVPKKRYAELLYEFAAKQVTKNQAAVSMAVNPSTLKKRIKMMNSQPQKSYRKSIIFAGFSALFMIGIISCSDLQQNGITNNEVQQMQGDMAQKPAENDPLFIVNGERLKSVRAHKVVPRIKSKYIKNITVLKGEKAASKYGQAGANGVVEITLNAKEKALSDLKEKPEGPPVPSKENQGNYFVAVEAMPELIGGLKSVQSKIKYPETAAQAGIEGRVIVQFIVNEQGQVENPQVIRGIGGGCDEEALRVVKQAKFKPGKQNGKPVRVQYSLPITYRL